MDFFDSPVVKNQPSNAGDAGSILGRGTKIPHAAGQLSPHALESMHRNYREAHAPQRKIPCATTKTPRSRINK